MYFDSSHTVCIGTPITQIPVIDGQPLDMFKLYKLVIERGGAIKVYINL